MSAHIPRPWPIDDLLTAVGGRRNLCAVIGDVQVGRAIAKGALTDQQADAWAVKMGLVPYEVWPAMLDQAIQAEAVCGNEECGGYLPPGRRAYCSEGCRKAAVNARRRAQYASDPKTAKKRKAAAARYYQECAPAVRAKKRMAYQDPAVAEAKRAAERARYNADIGAARQRQNERRAKRSTTKRAA